MNAPTCHCLFCYKPNTEVEVMVSGNMPFIGICNECVNNCVTRIADYRKEQLADKAGQEK